MLRHAQILEFPITEFLISHLLGEKKFKEGGLGGRTGDSDALGKHERSLSSLAPKMVGQEARESRVSSPRGPRKVSKPRFEAKIATENR